MENVHVKQICGTKLIISVWSLIFLLKFLLYCMLCKCVTYKMLMYMCTHYRNAGMLLEEALANSLSQIASTVGIDNTVPLSALGTQLINLFPILLVS